MIQLCRGAVYIVPKLVFHVKEISFRNINLFCPVSDCYGTSSEHLFGGAGI